MTVTLTRPLVEDLPRVVAALASFQTEDEGAAQLHPGEIGWNQKDGAEALQKAMRVWERDGEPIVIGMGDGAVVRLAVSPTVANDEAVATSIADDLADEGVGSAEVRYGPELRRTLHARGWTDGEAWACFTSDLSYRVPDRGLRLAVIDGAVAEPLGELIARDVVCVHRASWERSAFTTEQFQTMATGPAFGTARFLVLYAGNVPVATACVWSAGPGRPGLIEPLGVDREQRGHGYGRAIVNACATALRDMGASSMRVASPVTQWPAVPLYAATMRRLPDVRDFLRPA